MTARTKTCLTLLLGAGFGSALAVSAGYLGVNFRWLPHRTSGFTITPHGRGLHADRITRIYDAFAHGLPLPCSSEKAFQVVNSEWLKPERIAHQGLLAGQVPVPTDEGDIFVLHLSSASDDLKGCIWFTLSGVAHEDHKSAQKAAFEFLTGKGPRDARLHSFSLCYHRGDDPYWRTETFHWWGITAAQH